MIKYKIKKFFVSAFFLPFLVLIICWPAALNGSAIFFYDSLSYLGSAATAFGQVFGLKTPWADASGDAAVPLDGLQDKTPQDRTPKTIDLQSPATEDVAGPRDSKAAAVQSQSQSSPTIIAGRSIYYGAFLFIADILGSLWLALGLQALIVILSIYMTFLVILLTPLRQTFLILIMLGVFSSLPFYVSYLMPDFLTGVVILAVANLIAFGTRMQRWMLLVWGLLLLFGLVSHTSHILIAGIMVIGWGIVQGLRRRAVFVLPLAICISALGTAVVAELVFFKAVETVYGASPVRPPFLMARMISDGPGYNYLIANCGRHDLRICDFIDVLPQSTDYILWSKDPQTGVYAISDAETKQDLKNQEMEFVLSVLRYDPVGQISASLQGFVKQLMMISLNEFIYTSSLKTNLKDNLPADQIEYIKNTRLYKDRFPLTYFSILSTVVVLLSIIYLFYFYAIFIMRNHNINYSSGNNAGGAYGDESRCLTFKNDIEVTPFVTLVIYGVLSNAIVTGILSMPHDRYQSRVVWLVPFLSMYLISLGNKYLAPPGLASADTSRISAKTAIEK